MKGRLCAICLLIVAGCLSVRLPQPKGPAVVFVLDSAVNRGFIAGRVFGLQASDVTHGSLVGRVVLSHCRARLVSVRVEDPDGRIDRGLYIEGLRSVLNYAETHPDRKILLNISLSTRERDAEEEELVRRLTVSGALVVAAAGNEDTDSPMYPAAYDGVIAVASATRRGKALHSNFGRHVDIAASGDISFIDYDFLPYEWLRREMAARGTSFAAPRVAATVAFVLNHAPDLSPRQAYGIVESTARPIDDRYFRDGMLGAGLLDVRRAKSEVAPAYRFAHFVLPVCVWVILGIASVYLCLRHGSVGLFITLMMWLVGLPSSFLLVIELGRWLQFVGRGSLVVGLGVASVLCTGGALSLAIQGWNVTKTAVAAFVPCGVLVVLSGTGPAESLGPIWLALAAAGVTVATAGAWELATHRKLRAIRSLPAADGSAAAARLQRAYRRTLDRRIRKAVVEMLGAVDDEAAVEFLLHERRYPRLAVESLASIARRGIGPLSPALRGPFDLGSQEQERLLLAIRKGANPEAVPFLREILQRGPSRLVEEVLASLESSPDAG